MKRLSTHYFTDICIFSSVTKKPQGFLILSRHRLAYLLNIDLENKMILVYGFNITGVKFIDFFIKRYHKLIIFLFLNITKIEIKT